MTGYWRSSERIAGGTAYSLALYGASRVVVAGGAAAAAVMDRRVSWRGIMTGNDAWWYQLIARRGYGSHLQLHLLHDHFHDRFSPWAFYPGYPTLIRLTHDITRLGFPAAALLVALVAGAAAVRAVYALGAELGGHATAEAAAGLFAFWPGSAALTLPYSEGLFVAGVAASLVALVRRRWWTAGLTGLVATLTRPMGLALLVAAVVAVTYEIRTRRRGWRPVIAPVLTAAGAAAFYGFGWVSTGDALVWRHAEDLWKQRFDFGATWLWHFGHDLDHRNAHGATTWLLVLGLMMLAAGVVAAMRLASDRLPAALLVYAGVATIMILGYGHVGPRPRMVLAVVPVFIWVAQAVPRKAVTVVMAVSAGLLGLTSALFVTVVVP